MSTLAAIVGLTILAILALELVRIAIHRIRYALEVRHLPNVTEWDARQNAAPLSSAIIHVVGDPPDRGDG